MTPEPMSARPGPPTTASSEAARLSALRRLDILDTPPDDAFDRITQLASRIFEMPISLVTLVDENRQWFKSCWGLADYGVFTRETPLEISFCVHALAEQDVMVVPDTALDPRFRDSPVVTGSPGVRFYAGAPLRVQIPDVGERRRVDLRLDARRDGYRRSGDRRQAERRDYSTRPQDDSLQNLAIGTLCLLDTRPRAFSRRHRDTLIDLACLVENELRLRFTARLLQNEVAARCTVENALRQSRLRFQTAFEYSAIGMALISLDGRWLQINDRLCDLFGYSETELRETTLRKISHPDDEAEERRHIDDLLNGRENSYQMTRRFFHRDGHMVWAQLDVSLARDAAGVPQYFVFQVQDMSGRRAAEESRRAAHAEAEQQRAHAERANAAKSEFLSRMSHELRTPLNAVLGFGQLLELSDLSAPDRESVTQIIKAGGHLLALINEVLDIARIESGSLSLSPEPVRLAEIVIEAVDLIRPLAAKRNLTIEDEQVRRCSCTVYIDRQRFKQALLNLLSNAVKYNADGGRIAVTCTVACDAPAEGMVRVAVQDGGPGLGPEQAECLFQPFERLGADARGIEGTGIGLVLARRMAEAMGGALDFHSKVGQGSTFWLDVPVTGREPAAKEAPEKRVAASSIQARTVLHIEDNGPNVHLMEHIFATRPNFRLLTAMQGGLGLELARQHHPDVILLDLNLPDWSGEEILRNLKSDDATRNTPVIALSADATPQQIRRMREAGAVNYLTKPFDVGALLQAVDHALEDS